MKNFKFLFISGMIVFLFAFVSCKNQQDSSGGIMLLTDSTIYNNSASSDTARIANERTQASNKRGSAGKQTSVSPKQGNSSTTVSTKQGTEKKGWSKAAQGAVIGGATGAVGGAIIARDKVAGAAIGAAVGAAGGYIIGRDKDKKDGRVKKNKRKK